MLGTPFELWDEWVVAIACAFTSACCLLHLNAMGRPFFDRLVERALCYSLGFGAVGSMIGPFCGWFILPTVYELTFYMGVALYAIWLTKGHWMEMPVLDRRHTVHKVDIPKQAERRGAATEEEEDIACSH